MSDHSSIHGAKTGTVGGTLLVILANIHYADIIQTAILATIGAAASFFVTVLLKWLSKKWKKR